jgi:calcium-dependent protein kinase
MTRLSTGGQERAIKRLNLSLIKRLDSLEITMLDRLSRPGHKNVCRLHECAADQRYVYLCLDYAEGGELFSLIEKLTAKNKTIPEARCQDYFRQIVAGVNYIHSKGVCHGDLSCENCVLAQKRKVVRIIDFGRCEEVQLDHHGVPYPVSPMRSVSRPLYTPPEVLLGLGYCCGFTRDIWALGVMLFIMLSGAPPYESPIDSDPHFAILRDEGPSALLDAWEIKHVSEEAKGMRLTTCLCRRCPTLFCVRLACNCDLLFSALL